MRKNGSESELSSALPAGNSPPAENCEEIRRRSIEELIRVQVAQATDFMEDSLEGPVGLAQAGFDSLNALELKNVLQQELGADIPLAELFSAPSISALARQVADRPAAEPEKSSSEPIGPAPSWEEGSL